MRELMEEYGGMVIGLAGTAALLALFRVTFLSWGGGFPELIALWGNGGC